MSEFLSIPYLLETEPGLAEIESFLQFCFDDLGCSRSPPDSDDTHQFGHSTQFTDGICHGATVGEVVNGIVRAEGGTIWLWYDDLNVGIHIPGQSPRRIDVPNISLSIDEWYAKPRNNDQPELIPEFVHALYDYLSPRYVYGDRYLDESTISVGGVERGELEDFFWVNGFGPEMVDTLGRERVLEAPAWRVDEREDGGIFLWVSALPLSMNRNENMAALKEYFGFES